MAAAESAHYTRINRRALSRRNMLRFNDISKFILNGKLHLTYNNGGALKPSDGLLKVRLWVYSLAFVHLVTIAIKLLTLDFTKASDPSIWAYETFRWKLITCWFNILSLAYFPICIYCDYKDLKGESHQPLVKKLSYLRFLVYTSILFPTTTFADVLFWRLWMKDRELLAPLSVDEIVPFWTQHCMHTVTLVVNILDLLLVPRKRPESFKPGLITMTIFLSSYFCVAVDSYLKGEYLYPLIKLFTGFRLLILILYVVVEHLFYYFAQFIVSELIWGKERKEKQHLL